jgi:hypothetical protein
MRCGTNARQTCAYDQNIYGGFHLRHPYLSALVENLTYMVANCNGH